MPRDGFQRRAGSLTTAGARPFYLATGYATMQAFCIERYKDVGKQWRRPLSTTTCLVRGACHKRQRAGRQIRKGQNSNSSLLSFPWCLATTWRACVVGVGRNVRQFKVKTIEVPMGRIAPDNHSRLAELIAVNERASNPQPGRGTGDLAALVALTAWQVLVETTPRSETRAVFATQGSGRLSERSPSSCCQTPGRFLSQRRPAPATSIG